MTDAERPVCAVCHKVMTPANSTIRPELFMCDECIWDERERVRREEGI